MQFRDRRHQQAVQQAEKADAMAQRLIADFCQLINFPYQQQQGLFATSYYTSLFAPETLRGPGPASSRPPEPSEAQSPSPALVVPEDPSAEPSSLTGMGDQPAAVQTSQRTATGIDENLAELMNFESEQNSVDLPIGDSRNVVTAPEPTTDVDSAEFAGTKIDPSDARPLPEAIRSVKEELAAEPHGSPHSPPSGGEHGHKKQSVVETLEERSTHAEHEDTLPAGPGDDGFDAILDEIDHT